ncbi:MAG: protein-L-isoaspartate O-methyltransferase, partial [Burkholderiaceae bacterium]
MSSTPRRSRFPLPLDAVVERKPAPARTAGMPAVGKRAASPAPAPT